jgi:Zn-dependent M16 (insulinase) family peptidase
VYLKRLKKRLEREPEKVVGWFKTIRDSLFTFQNLRFLVTANLIALPDPLTTWNTLSESLIESKTMIDIPKPVSLLNDEGRNPGSVGEVIVPMTTLEGSYSVSTTKGIASYNDPRYVPIMVAIGYLEATEGPLWNAVRGARYAYGAYFSTDITSGIISYNVYRSPDACKAMKASKEAISKIADGSVEIDHHLLQGTISQIVVEIADGLSSMPSAGLQNFAQGVVRGLPNDWNNTLLQHVRDVSIDQTKTALRESVMPCFEPGKSNIVVTAAKIMQEVCFPSSHSDIY